MRIHAINLDRQTGRWSRFLDVAGVADVVRFAAVDGAAVNRTALADNGFIAEPLSRTDAALGRTCSHVALWYQALETSEPLTIVEDHAVLAATFPAAAQQVLDALTDWDLVVWGWDLDSVLWAQIPEGVSVCRVRFDRADMPGDHLETFRTGTGPHTAVRLQHCLGSFAYTVRPAGARALLEACLPITDRRVTVGADATTLANTTPDVDLNLVYPAVRAYACFPPLALAGRR